MDGREAADRASRVLLALADLSPSAEQRQTSLTIPTEWFRWIAAGSVGVFAPSAQVPLLPRPVEDKLQRYVGPPPHPTHFASIERSFGEKLAAVDQIRPGQNSIRAGWLFVAGRMKRDGKMHRVFHPLVSAPIRIVRPVAIGDARVVRVGDVQVSDLIADMDLRAALESSIEIGGGSLDEIRDPAIPPAWLARLTALPRFARAAADAAGLRARELVPATESPDQLMRQDGLKIVAGVGVFAAHETGSTSRAGSLRSWAFGPLGDWTAFHSMYVGEPPQVDPPHENESVRSPYVLTKAQRSAVRSSRVTPITLVSGAPGTGKSHTVVAIACDALARGQSVLVAAKADATVDALLDLFERAPGPDPIVFGSNERTDALAERLAAGQLTPLSTTGVEQAANAQETAWRKRDATLRKVLGLLGAEAMADGGDDLDARMAAPGLFDASTDLEAVSRAVEMHTSTDEGWWARWRSRRRWRSLLQDLRCPGETSTSDLRSALSSARALRAMVGLEAAGGLEIGDLWDRLADDDSAARDATGRWLAAESRSADRLKRSSLEAISTLATALRSGRAARRQQLTRLDERLTRALPLWVGSLPDIDDLLPARPALFDLVILDEASSVDQPLAAPALLRGRRGVVVGDPQQLRHVSFLSDDQMQNVSTMHQLDTDPLLVSRLDVRRNSAFDAAAAVAPVQTLDEHFRSDPHLVDFVAERLYGGSVRVATRAPSTQSKDCIDLVRLEGARDDDGVVRVEIDWCIRHLREMRRAGVRSIGIVTPFRAQADALEEAMLREFRVDDLEALDLRVGTVHAFQGNERDHVIAALGLGPQVTANSWRFVEDPHLFAVLATRARKHMTVLLSADPPANGLVADYIAQADAPPGAPAPASAASSWVQEIAHDLAAAGVPTITSYPTGPHVLDIVTAEADITIECEVHPDGPEAHVERHLELRRAGWTILEAHRSRWQSRRGELVVRLLDQIRRP